MIFRVIGALILVLILLSTWAWRDYQVMLTTPTVTGNPVTIEIIKGDSFNQITEKLIQQKVNFKPFWFKALAVQQKNAHKLKTGEYELTPGLTLPEILAMFVQGKTKKYSITFPEGWSFKEIIKEINSNEHLEHTLQPADVNHLKFQPSTQPEHDGTDNSPPQSSLPTLEGMLFPDTYYFEKHDTDATLIKRAYDKMQSVLTQEWANKAENLPFKNSYEALVLASIVEKETAQVTERPLIAGVFIRRLQLGIMLQTDPTVIYGMGDSYQGNISSNDLKTPTPYNTYTFIGLPPSPIAMPGRDAIYATLHPDNSNNLYFVARGDGSHQFSAMLKDHNKAVVNFQRKKNAKR